MSRPVWITLTVVAVVALGIVLFFVLAPSQAGNTAKFNRTYTPEEQQLIDERAVSAEELTAADGADGASAWIAVDGVVYDLSASKYWVGGEHHGHIAGRDLTQQFLESGHGVGILQNLTVVGAYSP